MDATPIRLRIRRTPALLGATLLAALHLCADPIVAVADVQIYGPDQGFPSITIEGLLCGRDGALWIASTEGVARYDGITLSKKPLPFGISFVPSFLVSPYLAPGQRMREAPDGSLWVSNNDHFLRFDGNKWTVPLFVLGSQVPQSSILSFDFALDGTLWYSLHGGSLWRGRAPDDGTPYYPLPEMVLAGSGDIYQLATDGKGIPWALRDDGANGRNVYRFESGSMHAIGPPDTACAGSAAAILRTEDGRIWIVGKGLSSYDGTAWSCETIAAGVFAGAPYVAGIAESPGHGLWIAAPGKGLIEQRGARTVGFVAPIDLPHVPFGPIAADEVGNVWYAAENTLVRFAPHRRKIHHTSGVLDPQNARTPTTGLVFRSDGTTIWADSTLAIASHRGLTRLAFPDSAGPGFPYVDASDSVWLDTKNGLFHLDGTQWTLEPVPGGGPGKLKIVAEGPSPFPLLALGPDSYYVGRRGQWQAVPLDSLLPCDGSGGNELQGRTVDGEGVVWSAYFESGVVRYDPVRGERTCWPACTPPALDCPFIHPIQLLINHANKVYMDGPSGELVTFESGTWKSVPSLFPTVVELVNGPDGTVWFLNQEPKFGDRRALVGEKGGTFTPYSRDSEALTSCLATGGFYWAPTARTRAWIGGVPEGRYDHACLVDLTNGSPTRLAWTPEAPSQLPFPLASVAADGSIWFVGPKEVWAYDPEEQPPQTILVGHPDPIVPTRNVNVSFTTAYQPAAKFEASLDGGPWTDLGGQTRWDVLGLPDGRHTIQVRSSGTTGAIDPRPARAEFTVDATPPAPELTTPLNGAIVHGIVEVSGTTLDDRFRSSRVELWASPDDTAPGLVDTLASDTLAAENTALVGFDSRPWPDGAYELRLTVADSLGLEGVARVRIIVDNKFPPDSLTSPVDVAASDGGDVYSLDGDAHLLVTAGAFEHDLAVQLDALAGNAVPKPIPSGAASCGPALRIGWSEGTGRLKPLLLDLCAGASCDSSECTASSVPPAVWFHEAAGPWKRLGGSYDEAGSRIALAITASGVYAVFAGGDSTLTRSAVAGVGGLSFVPRLLVRSNPAMAEIGIAFDLLNDTSVSVRVYNRAGRLVREVVRGDPMTAGRNVVRWNGKDSGGSNVADGVYIVHVQAGSEERTGNILVQQ